MVTRGSSVRSRSGSRGSAAALADLLRDLGWKVEEGASDRAGTRLDVVVDEV